MSTSSRFSRVPRWVGASLIITAFLISVVLLMLWLAGAFKPKIQGREGAHVGDTPGRLVGDATVVEFVGRTMPLEETAVGTIEPLHRVEVASRLLAKAIEVNVLAG